jgi:hypothetical protein
MYDRILRKLGVKMAPQPRKGSSRADLKQDPLVDKLRPDPSQPAPDVASLVGFLGKASGSGRWRLYLSAELNEFVEIAEADIVASESIATERNPLGGTRLWIKRDAKLPYTRIESRQVQAEFLQGKITENFLPRAAMQRAGMGGVAMGPEEATKLDFCYSVGEWFCTLGVVCTKAMIGCTADLKEGHRTREVVCYPIG